ncbi:MAG: SMP-30/gluconolactonase/LRE family protein [Nocardioides sp.]
MSGAYDVEVFAGDLGWTEGPVVRHGSGEVLVVSIDRGHLYQADGSSATRVAVTGGGPNGATEGLDGSIYVSQDGGNSERSQKTPGVSGGVQVLRPNGRVEALTTDLVSPNDLCLGPDGQLYVTDPTRPRARHDGRLWRVDPQSGASYLITSLDWYPNGIGFGPEPDAIYVADSNGARIVRFGFEDGGVLGEPETFAAMRGGRPDGFCFDAEGNLVVAVVGADDNRGSVAVHDRSGALVEQVFPGPHQKYTNVALDQERRLFITDSEGGAILLIEDWPTAGLPLHPFRQESDA